MKTHCRVAAITTAACVLATTAWGGAGHAAPQEETRPAQTTMRGIFFTLTMVYAYSLDPDAYEDPANHMQIQSGLQALVANSSELERHGAGLNPSYGYFRRSLARDAQDALERFNKGQYMGSRFVVARMTENCVSCHTKLPERGEFDLGSEFLRKSKIKKLKPEERVQLEIATRQFDAAMATYESLFAQPEMTPENLALLGAFARYIRLCVAVKNDPQRAIRTLETYAKRTDLSATSRAQVKGWIAQLEAADLSLSSEDELVVARKLVEESEAARKHPSDRSRLVDYVLASTLLNRYIEAGPHDETHTAEAFYLMGVAEARVSRSYWVSETDYLLEQAIRTAPKSEIAKQAYEFLSEYTIAGHAEASAREISPDLKADLEELRKLIEQ